MRETTGIILIGLVFCGVIFVIMFIASYVDCKNKWIDFDNRYSPISGCMLKLNGKWVPSSAYYYKEGK